MNGGAAGVVAAAALPQSVAIGSEGGMPFPPPSPAAAELAAAKAALAVSETLVADLRLRLCEAEAALSRDDKRVKEAERWAATEGAERVRNAERHSAHPPPNADSMLAAAFSSGLAILSEGGPEATVAVGEAGADSAARPTGPAQSADAEPPPPTELLDLPLEMLVLVIDHLPSGRCAFGGGLCVRWLGSLFW